MLNSPLIKRLIQLAIDEDLSFGDITSELCIPIDAMARAKIIARENLIVCGLPLVQQIVHELGYALQIELLKPDGAEAKDNDVLVELSGPTRQLLASERLMLNFLQRLSGVATVVRKVVNCAPTIAVLDTRKTTPGWRMLEKYAVRVGGAKNHRLHLGDMILVKNNHVDAHKGGMRAVLNQIIEQRPPYMPMEVEVRSIDELKAVIEFKPALVMLDNMNDFQIKGALTLIRKEAPDIQVEVSGGITEARLKTLAQIGVHCVSMGSLTSKAENVDISMKLSHVSRKKQGPVLRRG